jgi:hypothetical protein
MRTLNVDVPLEHLEDAGRAIIERGLSFVVAPVEDDTENVSIIIEYGKEESEAINEIEEEIKEILG